VLASTLAALDEAEATRKLEDEWAREAERQKQQQQQQEEEERQKEVGGEGEEGKDEDEVSAGGDKATGGGVDKGTSAEGALSAVAAHAAAKASGGGGGSAVASFRKEAEAQAEALATRQTLGPCYPLICWQVTLLNGTMKNKEQTHSNMDHFFKVPKSVKDVDLEPSRRGVYSWLSAHTFSFHLPPPPPEYTQAARMHLRKAKVHSKRLKHAR